MRVGRADVAPMNVVGAERLVDQLPARIERIGNGRGHRISD
jgi:hypothetical protein